MEGSAAVARGDQVTVHTYSHRGGPTPADMLATSIGNHLEVDPGLLGFGGLHGGLTLALLTSAMAEHAPQSRLRSTTAHYLRPLRGTAHVDSRVIRQGRVTTITEATASNNGEPAVQATAVWGTSGGHPTIQYAPPAVAAPTPNECPVFALPLELVPFAQHVEVRPVGEARPFAGGASPELTAWMRLLSDDQPPDALRIITLIDALPPSYAAVMTVPGPLPTVELTVRPAMALTDTSSPWVLVRASTHASSPDGWLDEHIDVWGVDATHLASARQLRVLRALGLTPPAETPPPT